MGGACLSFPFGDLILKVPYPSMPASSLRAGRPPLATRGSLVNEWQARGAAALSGLISWAEICILLQKTSLG